MKPFDKNKVLQLIRDAKVEQAITYLEEEIDKLGQEELERRVTFLSGDFSKLRQKEAKGTIAREEAGAEENKIEEKVLNLASDLDHFAQFGALPDAVPTTQLLTPEPTTPVSSSKFLTMVDRIQQGALKILFLVGALCTLYCVMSLIFEGLPGPKTDHENYLAVPAIAMGATAFFGLFSKFKEPKASPKLS